MFSPEFMKFLISYQKDEVAELKEEIEIEKEQRSYSVPAFAKRKPIVIPIKID